MYNPGRIAEFLFPKRHTVTVGREHGGIGIWMQMEEAKKSIEVGLDPHQARMMAHALLHAADASEDESVRVQFQKKN